MGAFFLFFFSFFVVFFNLKSFFDVFFQIFSIFLFLSFLPVFSTCVSDHFLFSCFFFARVSFHFLNIGHK